MRLQRFIYRQVDQSVLDRSTFDRFGLVLLKSEIVPSSDGSTYFFHPLPLTHLTVIVDGVTIERIT